MTNTGNKANTSQNTSVTVLTTLGKGVLQAGVGPKVIETLYGAYADDKKATEYAQKAKYRKDEALSVLTASLVNVMQAEKRSYQLALAAFNSDRKSQGAANDFFRAALDMGTFTADPDDATKVIFNESAAVRAAFAKDKAKESEAFRRGDYAYKNFTSQLKTAMQNAIGLVDLELDGIEIDPKTKALLISGPKVEQVFGQDTVVMNGSNASQKLKDNAPEATLKTLRTMAEKQHGTPSASGRGNGANAGNAADSSTTGTQVPDGNVPKAVQSVGNSLIALVNKLEGKADEDTARVLSAVANAIWSLLPPVFKIKVASQPIPSMEKANDTLSKDISKATSGVTLAKSAGKPAGKRKAA